MTFCFTTPCMMTLSITVNAKLCYVTLLSVTIQSFMLSVVLLNVVMQSVAAPLNVRHCSDLIHVQMFVAFVTVKTIAQKTVEMLHQISAPVDKIQLNLGRVFNSRSGRVYVMQLPCFETKLPILKLKNSEQKTLR